MIQPFSSIYTKSYRWFGKDEDIETAKPCLYFSELKENFRPLEDSKAIYNPERDEAVIKDINLKRLATIYQTTYCATVGKKSLVIDPDDLEADEFMVYFNNYFKKRTQAIPSPLFTARRVNGYCRFDNYYTGKTTYQDEISKEAYEYFKRDYEKGLSRLFRKKQMEKHRLREKAFPDSEPQEEKRKTVEKKESDVIEKVCALCCEKYGEFFSNAPESSPPTALPTEENTKKNESEKVEPTPVEKGSN